MKRFKGWGVSPLIGIGKAFVLKSENICVLKNLIQEDFVETEIKRFQDAVLLSKKDIQNLKSKIADKLNDDVAAIFETHLLMLEDTTFIYKVTKLIRQQLFTSEFAISKAIDDLKKTFVYYGDEMLKERVSDLIDIRNRLLKHLIGKNEFIPKKIDKNSIVVARDISPSESIEFDINNINGFITEKGSKISHTSIIGKALNIPTVVGVGDGLLDSITDGVDIIVDAVEGEVIIAPDESLIKSYIHKMGRINYLSEKISKKKSKEIKTLDKQHIKIKANMELLNELKDITKRASDGIGLYRTEFLYMNRKDLPSEEEQFKVYYKSAIKVYPGEITIRTLDLGGDKFVSDFIASTELKKILDIRAIRFCLENPKIFKTQLSAIIRSNKKGNVKILLPMISSIDELIKSKEIIDSVYKKISKTENIEKPKTGIMIEIPSVALQLDEFAKFSDFFAVGTNDLTKYFLAVDRINEKSAKFFKEYHPAMLKLLKKIKDELTKYNKKVTICGESASDFRMISFLLGIGYRELSVNSAMIPEVAMFVKKINISELQHIAQQMLSFNTIEKVEDFFDKELYGFIKDKFGEFFELININRRKDNNE